MSQECHAIYENGVLRPITPLDLPESAEVALIVATTKVAVWKSAQCGTEELRRQQAALDAMFREVDSLPQVPMCDGLSGRDHDQILYGTGK